MPTLAQKMLGNRFTVSLAFRNATSPDVLDAIRDGTLHSSVRARIEAALIHSNADRDHNRNADFSFEGHRFVVNDLLQALVGTKERYARVEPANSEPLAFLAVRRIIRHLPDSVLWTMLTESDRVRAGVASFGEVGQVRALLGYVLTHQGDALSYELTRALMDRTDAVAVQIARTETEPRIANLLKGLANDDVRRALLLNKGFATADLAREMIREQPGPDVVDLAVKMLGPKNEENPWESAPLSEKDAVYVLGAALRNYDRARNDLGRPGADKRHNERWLDLLRYIRRSRLTEDLLRMLLDVEGPPMRPTQPQRGTSRILPLRAIGDNPTLDASLIEFVHNVLASRGVDPHQFHDAAVANDALPDEMVAPMVEAAVRRIEILGALHAEGMEGEKAYAEAFELARDAGVIVRRALSTRSLNAAEYAARLRGAWPLLESPGGSDRVDSYLLQNPKVDDSVRIMALEELIAPAAAASNAGNPPALQSYEVRHTQKPTLSKEEMIAGDALARAFGGAVPVAVAVEAAERIPHCFSHGAYYPFVEAWSIATREARAGMGLRAVMIHGRGEGPEAYHAVFGRVRALAESSPVLAVDEAARAETERLTERALQLFAPSGAPDRTREAEEIAALLKGGETSPLARKRALNMARNLDANLVRESVSADIAVATAAARALQSPEVRRLREIYLMEPETPDAPDQTKPGPRPASIR